MNTPFAPIALFAYNRPLHTRMCVESLLRNPEAAGSDLRVYCDGAKGGQDAGGVAQVRQYLRSVSGFRTVEVIEAPQNRGLAASVIAGVTETLGIYGRIIVVEDDLLVSPHFLSFMNEALTLYADEPRVGNVHGHLFRMHGLPDTFLIRHADSWGWGTWSRAWAHFEPDGSKLLSQMRERGLLSAFDFGGTYPFTRMLERQIEGRNNSWAIRWKASLLVSGMLAVNAGRSLVGNNGFDDTGTNCGGGELLPTDLYDGPVRCFRPSEIEESAEARRAFERMYRRYNSKLHKGRVILEYRARRCLAKLKKRISQ